MTNPSQKPKIPVLVGATASGKTAAGVMLANLINAEVISADAMQIYRKMAIGTAKPMAEEMAGVPHHLIDCVEPDEAFSVADYQERASKAIKDILSRGKVPLIVGGTGLYINALTMPWHFAGPPSSETNRKAIEKAYDEEGADAVYQKLVAVDPEAAAKIHPNNRKRVVRALEIYESTGKTKTVWEEEARAVPMPYDFVMLGITMDRAVLYNRIDKRVDNMMAAGLLDEVKGLLADGYTPDLLSMQALGYKELIPAVTGETDLAECVRILKRDTRHFAKRQLTWFRRDKRIHWFDTKDYGSTRALAEAMAMVFSGANGVKQAER